MACSPGSLSKLAFDADSTFDANSEPVPFLYETLQKLAGAGTVMVADISETRLGMADTYGADLLINSAKEDLEEAVMRRTGGIGADVVITAVPVPAIQQQSVRMAARQGRINLFGGLPKGGPDKRMLCFLQYLILSLVL